MAAAPAPAASPDAADGEESDHANDSPHDDVVHNAPPFCFIERAHPSRRRTLCTISPAPVCWRNNGNQIPLRRPPKEKPTPRNLLWMCCGIFLAPNRRLSGPMSVSPVGNPPPLGRWAFRPSVPGHSAPCKTIPPPVQASFPTGAKPNPCRCKIVKCRHFYPKVPTPYH